MSAEHCIEAGQQVALNLAAGAEVFCASGDVQLCIADGALGIPWSLELGPGRGWRAATRTRVVVNARSQARLLVHSPQVENSINCPKWIKWTIWSECPPPRPSSRLEKC